jgi:DNA helicase-2/ATP-dependent DNA helicase PcrA
MGMTTFERLNAAQRSAAEYGTSASTGRGWQAGPLLIVAGAGTGKTNTLAHRVAWLVLAGVEPDRILLLTFTRRAAQEMTRRAQNIVDAALRERAGGAGHNRQLHWAGTFHSIANRLLRQFARNVGLDPGFSVLDRGDSADLIDVVRHELALSLKDKRFPRKDTCLAIYSHRVNTQGSLEATLRDHYPWCLEWLDELKALFREYTARKQADRLLDFDDLLLYWHILMSEASLARAVAGLFDHVLVDEYQDTNSLQAEILLRMKPDGAGVTVVGDDAQAIYSFRAATVENILNFPAGYTPAAAVVTLEENYRSTQCVLDAANTLIEESSRQHRKVLRTTRGAGEPPCFVTVEDLREQADYVAQRVLENREAGVLLRRQAVLFRSSSHSDLLEIELTRRNIPFVKYGGLRFLEAAHVKDLLAVLRWADNPRNAIAGFRVLQMLAGMGPANSRRCLDLLASAGHSLDALARFDAPAAAAEQFHDLSALLPRLADPATPWPGQVRVAREWYEPLLERLYEAAYVRATDLEQLEQLSMQYPSRERFLTELALDPPNASGDEVGPPLIDEDYLILSTVHSAKGQEWDSVFVLNVTDGSFPSEFSGGKPEQIEEERRLLYVAMTRARSQLELLCPQRFHITQQPKYGDAHVYGARSRFLTERVLACFRQVAGPRRASTDRIETLPPTLVDAGARLRDLW